LSTDQAGGSGQSIPPSHGWQIYFNAVPEPSSGVLVAQLGAAAGLAILATRWARRKAAPSN
jgi:hypothetical protein